MCHEQSSRADSNSEKSTWWVWSLRLRRNISKSHRPVLMNVIIQECEYLHLHLQEVSTAVCKSAKKDIVFDLNFDSVTKDQNKHHLYAVKSEQALFGDCSRWSLQMNKDKNFIKCRLKFCSKVFLWRCHLQTWLFQLISSWWQIRKQRICRSAVRKVQDSLTDCISISFTSKQNDQEGSSFLVNVAVKNIQRKCWEVRCLAATAAV